MSRNGPMAVGVGCSPLFYKVRGCPLLTILFSIISSAFISPVSPPLHHRSLFPGLV
jgi:hypothetical protein